MILKEIEKTRLALKHAGTVADREQFRQSVVAQLRNDIEVLSQRKSAVKDDFRKRLEKWETRAVPENAPVLAHPGDAQDSRLYRLTGAFALLCEMALAAWIFGRLGVPWWIGALTALGITFTLHGVFLYLFEDEDRPKATMHRIKVFAALPAIIGFLLALAGGALARYVTGQLAYVLLPLFSFSLWLGTLSLIVLAASLFTIAHLRGWAGRHEKGYRRLDTEERASTAFLQELAKEEAEVVRVESERSKPLLELAEPSSNEHHSLGAMIILAAVLISNSACVGIGASEGMTGVEFGTQLSTDQSSSSQSDLHVFIDWSGSCVRPPLDEAWATVKSELPAVIEQHRIGTLTIWSFDQDGWSPNRLKELQLPLWNLPGRPKLDGGEWESFSNIREAVRQAETQEWQRLQSREQHRHRQDLKEALAPMDSVSVLPEPNYQTPRSDPVGLLQRISATQDNRAQYVIVLTDLADTQRRILPRLSAPRSEVHLLFLLIPAQRSDALLTLGKPLAGPEQFEERLRQLREMAPWASAAPYFAHNLAALLKPSNRSNQ